MTNKVFQAINAVQEELSKTGIAKLNDNQQQRYKFRGIDDVYNALAPVLAKHKLVIMPKVLSREATERQTRNGGALFNVVVHVDYHFVSAEDGSEFVVSSFGEAMDSADKATNKAMSAAYKYAAFQSFCIPTEGDNDADATTHDIKPQQSLEHLSAQLSKCQTMDELRAFWAPLTPEQRHSLKAVKDQRKTELEEHDKPKNEEAA